jgi:UDP-glucuronate decarboxylase
MRILVTGGSGFIGSSLTERLLGLGHQVLVIDNFYTSDEKNIKHLVDNPNLEVVRHDVTNPYSAEVDAIYHLACPASPVHYQRFPVQTIKTSVIGSLNMLELAHKLQIPILLSSTSEVYGDPQISPQVEEYWGNVNPIGIRSCYDEGKRAAETLFFDYHRQFNVNIKIARIFNTYGPNMSLNDGRVVSNFIVQALRSEDITIYGDGSQTRSFCYVDDLVDGLIKLMESPDSVHGPINLGNPTERTVKNLADLVIAKTKSKSQVIFHELPQDDPKQRKPDISKARDILNWEPKIDIDQGLENTIKYFKTKV